ncbi:MAG: serine hydrolase, partial [Brevibacterium sp.]|nr:serine hydrolase [Brevibacterium sp.]
VGVKLSSDPQPVSLAHQHGTLAMFEAIAEAVPPKPEPGTVPPAASTAEHSAAPPSTAVSSTARRGAAPAGAAPSIAPRPFAAQPGIF